MCGIYGFAGKQTFAPTLMRALAILNIPRGKDSTGVFSVTGHIPSEFRCEKQAVAALEYINTADYSHVVDNPDALVIVGHNRFATLGKVSQNNAHPFQSGDTIGVHNGTISNFEEVKKFTGKRWAVDSRHLIHMLDTQGNLGPAKGKLNVAYCQRKDSANLRLIRHGHTLYYAVANDGSWFAFSSEKDHLERALGIAGVDIYDFDVRGMKDNSSLALFLTADGSVADIKTQKESIRHIETYGYGYNDRYSKWAGGKDYSKSKTKTTKALDKLLLEHKCDCEFCETVGRQLTVDEHAVFNRFPEAMDYIYADGLTESGTVEFPDDLVEAVADYGFWVPSMGDSYIEDSDYDLLDLNEVSYFSDEELPF